MLSNYIDLLLIGILIPLAIVIWLGFWIIFYMGILKLWKRISKSWDTEDFSEDV